MRLETGEGAPSFAPPLPFAFLPRASASCGIFHPFRGENRITYARMKSATLTVPLALAAIGWIAAPPPAGAQHKAPQTYDLIIRHGTIYDGSARPPFVGDVAIQGDKIVLVGSLKNARGRTEIDATGLAVAPGFINMLSWATESLLYDGRSQDRKSTRLNSSHLGISYAVFCLKKKNKNTE